MKLVIDTNTIISGSLWQEPPAKLVAAALGGKAILFFTLAMLLELRETLQQPRFSQRLAIQGETPETIESRFRAAGHEAAPAGVMPHPPGSLD